MLAEVTPELSFSHRTQPSYSLLLFVVVSLLLHLCLVWAMQSRVVITATTLPVATGPALPVETYLFVAPVASPAAAPFTATPPNSKQTRQNTFKSEVKTATQANDSKTNPTAALQQITAHEATAEPPQSENTQEADAKTRSHPVEPARSENITSDNIGQFTQRFFNQTDNRALDVIAREAAQQAYHQKTSPTLPKLSIPTEEEKLLKTLPQLIEIDCKNEVQRALTAISRFTGGRVSCGIARDIQPFLDARLNPSVPAKTAVKK